MGACQHRRTQEKTNIPFRTNPFEPTTPEADPGFAPLFIATCANGRAPRAARALEARQGLAEAAEVLRAQASLTEANQMATQILVTVDQIH